MYEVVAYPTAGAFLARGEGWLLESEDRHNLHLSLAYARAAAATDQADALFATVEEHGRVVGCVIRTPPHKLLITDMPLEAAGAVAETVADLYDEIPAVLGPEPAVEAVAMAWVAARGGGWSPGVEQRIYRLDEVAAVNGVPGRLRQAEEGDLELAVFWGDGFARDAGVQFATKRESIERWIHKRQLFIWDDGEPRSIAVAQGQTPGGVRVGYVYTPPEARRRGFASACVAEVSQRMLDAGRAFCVLYTDLSNPTSNAIYQRIGYRPVADVRDYDLIPEARA